MKCEETGKRCFHSRRRARAANRRLHNKVRVYLCPHCHCFHITSSEKLP